MANIWSAFLCTKRLWPKRLHLPIPICNLAPAAKKKEKEKKPKRKKDLILMAQEKKHAQTASTILLIRPNARNADIQSPNVSGCWQSPLAVPLSVLWRYEVHFEHDSAMMDSTRQHRTPPPCVLARRGGERTGDEYSFRVLAVLYRNELRKASVAWTVLRPRGSFDPTLPSAAHAKQLRSDTRKKETYALAADRSYEKEMQNEAEKREL